MNDLKPCPFCGDEPAKTFSSDCSSFYIQCMNEDCAIQPGVDTRDDEHAIAIWNKRAAPEAMPQEPTMDMMLAWINAGVRPEFSSVPGSLSAVDIDQMTMRYKAMMAAMRLAMNSG